MKNFIRLDLFGDEIDDISVVDGLTGDVIQKLTNLTIFPAQDYITSPERMKIAIENIEKELQERLAELRSE